jgi:hypothetical protein
MKVHPLLLVGLAVCFGESVSGDNTNAVAIVAMPSPRLDEPLEGNFIPSAVLARDAGQYLMERVRVVAVDTTRADASGDAPWSERDMEKYLKAERNWFSAKNSSADYAEFKAQGANLVIEIAIANYEIAFHKKLVLQVFVRVIDVGTGKILARSRAASFDLVDPMTTEQFKFVFAESGERIVATALSELKL